MKRLLISRTNLMISFTVLLAVSCYNSSSKQEVDSELDTDSETGTAGNSDSETSDTDTSSSTDTLTFEIIYPEDDDTETETCDYENAVRCYDNLRYAEICVENFWYRNEDCGINSITGEGLCRIGEIEGIPFSHCE